MSDALAELMASEHWPYIWPCYALAIATFAGLGLRAVVVLRRWEKRAREDAAGATDTSIRGSANAPATEPE